jgi:hypothetical protein
MAKRKLTTWEAIRDEALIDRAVVEAVREALEEKRIARKVRAEMKRLAKARSSGARRRRAS